MHKISTTKPIAIYQVLVSLDVIMHIPETLMQNSNMGIIGI